MASYIQQNLINNEHVEYETSYHWIIFFSLKSFLTLFIAPIISCITDQFAVTNKRVVMKTGLISRKTLEMNLSKIESVNVNQSVLGRILGFGTIIIIGTGGTREQFTRIRKPLQFRRRFQELSN